MVSPSKGEGRRVTQSTYVSTVFVALVSYWCVLGDTDRVSPNHRGSHQISSVRRTAGGKSSSPSDLIVDRWGS